MTRKVVLERFTCPGAATDCPPDGYLVLETEGIVPVQAGDALLSLDHVLWTGVELEIRDDGYEMEPEPEYEQDYDQEDHLDWVA